MARKKENNWQFKFSSILAVVMLLLIVGYFFQSYTEIRNMKPVQAAVEHVSSPRVGQIAEPPEPTAGNTQK
ncbi:hypothetical protein N9H39_11630 [Gammaproteobacteria bacterium]|nr:hypothetical protein [Gammaproteobacteria bacterium]